MSHASSRFAWVASIAAVALVVGVAVYALAASSYTARIVLPASSPNLREGMPFYIRGFEAGSVEEITPENNHAVVTVSVDSAYAPLHSGAYAHVAWKSVFGERILNVVDGPPSQSPIPDGGMLEGRFPRPTEMGDVLAAFDARTRDSLASLVGQLNDTTQGKEQQLNQTLRTLGPALMGVGEVLRGVGTDGDAIKALVLNLNRMLMTIDHRNPDVQAIVNELTRTTSTISRQHDNLRSGLERLPDTLRQAQVTLGHVPAVADETVPLLKDLQGATDRLPEVSRRLVPVLRDLRPTVEDLRPTLRAASVLLDRTPGLLDTAHGTFPALKDAARDYRPALEFIRPYTPDLVNWLTGWGSVGQNFDANGRYARVLFEQGGTSFDANPGVMPPGVSRDLHPAPSSAGAVPLSGADGEGMH